MTSPRLPRSAWTSTPAPAGTLLEPPDVVGLATHWNGPPVSAAVAAGDQEAVARYLEAIRRLHTMDPRNWSDIAYQQAVDQAGRRWELRGWRRRSAANGDTDPNRRYGAVLAIIGQGQQPTDAMLAGLADCRTDFRRVYPRATALRTHRQVRPEPTECPGDDLTRWVAAGGPNPEGDTMLSAKEIADAVWNARLSIGSYTTTARGWLTYTNQKVDQAREQLHELAAVVDELAARQGVTPAELEQIREAVRSQLPELVRVEVIGKQPAPAP